MASIRTRSRKDGSKYHTPPRSICLECGGDGQLASPCICPGWISVEDIAHADLKALLATNDLSLGMP